MADKLGNLFADKATAINFRNNVLEQMRQGISVVITEQARDSLAAFNLDTPKAIHIVA